MSGRNRSIYKREPRFCRKFHVEFRVNIVGKDKKNNMVSKKDKKKKLAKPSKR